MKSKKTIVLIITIIFVIPELIISTINIYAYSYGHKEFRENLVKREGLQFLEVLEKDKFVSAKPFISKDCLERKESVFYDTYGYLRGKEIDIIDYGVNSTNHPDTDVFYANISYEEENHQIEKTVYLVIENEFLFYYVCGSGI